MTRELDANAEKFTGLPWDQVKAKLIALDKNNAPFHKPLLLEHAFGKGRRKTLEADIVTEITRRKSDAKTEDGSFPEPLGPFISNTLVKNVHHSGDAAYANTLKSLRAAVFSSGAPIELAAAIGKAMDDFAAGGEGRDTELLEAIRKHSGGIVGFLKDLAEKGSVRITGDRTETLASLRDKLKGKTKEGFDGIYRNSKFAHSLDDKPVSSEQHEWIPTKFVLDIVARAQADIAKAEAAITDPVKLAKERDVALLWIDFQNELRAPTKGLVFNPNATSEHWGVAPFGEGAPFERTAYELKPDAPWQGFPVTTTRLADAQTLLWKGGAHEVLQGHPGALNGILREKYAEKDVEVETGDDGARTGTIKPKPFSKGSGKWHSDVLGDRIAKVALSNSSGTAGAMRGAYNKVTESFANDIMAPDDFKIRAKFPDYFSNATAGATRIDTGPLAETYGKMHAQAKRQLDAVEAVVGRAEKS
jgi:hypothetical protein